MGFPLLACAGALGGAGAEVPRLALEGVITLKVDRTAVFDFLFALVGYPGGNLNIEGLHVSDYYGPDSAFRFNSGGSVAFTRNGIWMARSSTRVRPRSRATLRMWARSS